MTFKQRQFIRNLVRTGNPTEAAFVSYNCKSRNTAKIIACQNMKKLGITMEQLLDKMGLGVEQDILDLIKLSNAKKIQSCNLLVTNENGEQKINKNSDDFIEVDDNQTQLKALELRLKLKGKLQTGTNVKVDNSQHNHYTWAELSKKYDREPILENENRIQDEPFGI